MNLVDLSKVLTESTLECCKKDVFPSDVDVFIENEDNSVSHVHCVQLKYSSILNSFIIVFCKD